MLNDKFKSNIINIYGEKGKKWLQELPKIIEEKKDKYKLKNITPIKNMNYNYIAEAIYENNSVILKLSPNNKAIQKEVKALNYLKNISVKVLVFEKNFFLMEKANPGYELKTFFPQKEQESIDVFCEILTKISKTIPNDNFYTVDELLKNLHKSKINEDVLKKALKIKDFLLGTRKNYCFLHGDLHHENILKSNNSWLVIDPKGFIGEIYYEVATFIRNPIPNLLNEKNAKEIITNRILNISEKLNLDKERLKKWVFLQSALCWSWQIEDNLDCSYNKKIINLLNEVS